MRTLTFKSKQSNKHRLNVDTKKYKMNKVILDNKLFQLIRQSAPQADCHLSVAAILTDELLPLLTTPDAVGIFILSLLIESIESESSPIFIFPHEKFSEAKAVILEWVEHEQNKHFLLPPLVIHYAWAVSANIDELLDNPQTGDAVMVRDKYNYWLKKVELGEAELLLFSQ